MTLTAEIRTKETTTILQIQMMVMVHLTEKIQMLTLMTGILMQLR